MFAASWDVKLTVSKEKFILSFFGCNYSLQPHPVVICSKLDTFGVDLNDRFRMQFNVKNVLDQTTAGDLGYRFADYIDQIGRRYTMAVTTKF